MEKYITVAIHSRSTYWSNKENTDEMIVDSDDLAKEITEKCNELNNQGYEVFAITPINSGNMSGGTGYYYTESVLLSAKKIT